MEEIVNELISSISLSIKEDQIEDQVIEIESQMWQVHFAYEPSDKWHTIGPCTEAQARRYLFDRTVTWR